MLSSTVFATLIALVAAAPHAGPSASTGDICGNGNAPRCCNDESVTNKLTAATVLDADLSHLLNANCPQIPLVNLLALPIDNKCRTNSVCCGKTENQVGLVPINCVPITIL